MALVECVECGGTVSNAAASCPHCGHPEPGGATGTGLPTPDTRTPKAEYREVQTHQATRPIWPIFIWAVGGFIVGVLVNALIETAGIALSGDFSWGLVYKLRWNWIRVLLPYTVSGIGTSIGLARRKKGDGDNYKAITYILGTLALAGVGVVLYGAYSDGLIEDDSISSDLYFEFRVYDTLSSRADPQFGSLEEGIPCIDDYYLGTDLREGFPIEIVDETRGEVVAAGELSEGITQHDGTGPDIGEPGHEIFYYCSFSVQLDAVEIQAGHTYRIEFQSDDFQEPIRLEGDDWISGFAWRYFGDDRESERERLRQAS